MLNGESTYIFSDREGLCSNLFNYACLMDYNYGKLSTEMREQFKDAGLDDFLPFNNETPYWWESDNGVTDKNVHRVQWVFDRVKEYEENV